MYIFLLFSYFVFFYCSFFKNRVFDFLTIYAIILTFYNIPTLFGIVVDPFTREYIAAGDEIFFSTSIIFLSSIPFYFLRNDFYSNLKVCKDVENNKLLIYFIISSILVFYVPVFLYYLPVILNSSSKKDLIESGSNLYSFFGLLPVLGFFISYKIKNKSYIWIFLILTSFIFIFGSRRPLVILLIGWFFIIYSGNRINIRKYIGMFFIGCVGLILAILGKSFYAFILRYGVDGIFLWISSFRFDYFVSGNEFMGRSSILNAIITNSFSVDTEHILKSTLAILPIPMSYFGYSSSAFNEGFQTSLFRDIDYGMAYNPWAEAYSWLGDFGIIIYSFIICSSLYLLWIGYCKSGVLKSSLIVLVGILIAFWVHRNSLGSQLAYIRNAFYPGLFSYIVGYILYSFFRRVK